MEEIYTKLMEIVILTINSNINFISFILSIISILLTGYGIYLAIDFFKRPLNTRIELLLREFKKYIEHRLINDNYLNRIYVEDNWFNKLFENFSHEYYQLEPYNKYISKDHKYILKLLNDYYWETFYDRNKMKEFTELSNEYKNKDLETYNDALYNKEKTKNEYNIKCKEIVTNICKNSLYNKNQKI